MINEPESFANPFPDRCIPTVVFAVGADTEKQEAFEKAFSFN